MKRFAFIIAILISCSIFFISCQKKKEEKILGSWQYVYLTNVGNTTQIWDFTEDFKFITKITTDTVVYDTANWSISAKAFSPTLLKINGIKREIDGTYKVLTLNRKYLIIQRIMLDNGNSEGAFNRIEFVKAN